MPELTVEVLKSQVSNRQKVMINDEVLAEIERLAQDPDYGPEFLESYMDHLNVFKESNKSHTNYLNAVKFFSLVQAGNSLTDAYIKTFPERFTARTRNKPDADKSIMRGEASRYNASVMVNEIRKAATITVQIVHHHILHEAILAQADLMRTARSEMVRQKAAACLITELKPAEENVLNVKVEDGAASAIEDLRKATERLAQAEYDAIQKGRSIKDVAESKLIIDVEVEEVTDGS